jgi:hypothetical protein
MGKTFESIDDSILEWMSKQKMFFVGTAPMSENGKINLSPKGHDSLRVIDGNTLAYLDYGGSGIETIAHLRENGRIVIMMCAFEGPPKIFRFYGTGQVVTPLDSEFSELSSLFDIPGIGIRAVIQVNLTRIQDSCGYGVPNYEYQAQRESSQNWTKKRGVDDIRNYQAKNNQQSLDGIPAISEAEARAYIAPKDST